MILREKDGLRWLEFELLQNYPHLIHGVFLKDDALDEKAKQYCRQKGVIKVSAPHQVHGDDVKNTSQLQIDPRCDGVFTREIDEALFIRHADCQAALFFDPKRNVIACVHSGWRGNVLNIYAKTVDTLIREAGCFASDLIVCISPSLGPCRSEFINYEKELPQHFLPFSYKPFYFDLWQISRHQLMEKGVLANNIEIASLCTYDHPNLFYSYRRDKTALRNVTMIALKG